MIGIIIGNLLAAACIAACIAAPVFIAAAIYTLYERRTK